MTGVSGPEAFARHGRARSWRFDPTVSTYVDERDAALLESEVNAFLDAYEASHRGLRYAVRRPVRTWAAVARTRRLPVLHIAPTRTPEGEALRHELTRGPKVLRTPLHTVFGAITVPASVAEYEAGSDKQTLRRKVRAAEHRGVTVEPVVDPALRRDLVAEADEYERRNPRELYRAASPRNDDLIEYELWLLARSSSGAPLLLSVTPIDGGVGVLRYFRTLSDDQAASDARYLMTRALVAELVDRGVHHLVDTTLSMHLSHGLRHFQRMVGFRLLRLEIAAD